MNNTDLCGKHIFVSGRVQGVFFRKFTQQQAEALSVTGWVRNTSDGKVELEAFGTQIQLEAFIEKLWKGPTAAEVVDVTMKDLEFESYEEFKVI